MLMRITYSEEVDALYITFRYKTKAGRLVSESLGSGIYAEYDEADELIALEVLDALFHFSKFACRAMAKHSESRSGTSDRLTIPELKRTHRNCTRNRARVLRNIRCGCFFCLAIFPPGRVKEWTDDGQTARCPRCGIDSVLPNSAFKDGMTKALLRQMKAHWFAGID